MLDWVALAALLVAIGALAGAPGLLLIAGITLAYGSLTRIWTRYGMREVSYWRTLGAQRAVVGDEVPLDITIWNRKPLPLPWIAADDPITDGIDVRERPLLDRDEQFSRRSLRNVWSLTWFERVVRHFHLQAKRRGVYEIGPARLRVRDLLGRGAVAQPLLEVDRLLVGPRSVAVQRTGEELAPLGDRRARRSLFSDPALFGGVRPFQPGDPLKRVHWRASARIGTTVSRRYEPARGREVVIVLDVQTIEDQPAWEMTYDDDAFESLCVAAISLGRRLLGEGAAVGLAAASFTGSTQRLAFVPPQASFGQVARLATLLARCGPISSGSLERLLTWTMRRVPAGCTLLILSVRDPGPMRPTLARLSRSGYDVEWVALQAGASSPPMHGSPRGARLVRARLDDTWRTARALVLGG
jgi:uncharacterized protein (DUF58 family)